jgi:drug/metabolite transporter (DMT)-like permease
MIPRHTFLAIIACLLWSTAFVGIKIGLQYTSPLQFAGIRFFISGLMILPFIPSLRSKIHNALPHYRKIILIGLIQTFLQYSLFYTGINYVPGAIGALVIGSGPLFVLVVAHYMMPGDLINRHKVTGIVIGLAGVAVITLGQGSLTLSGGLLGLGILILLMNNVLAGFGNVLVAKSGSNIPPLVLSAFSMIVGGFLLFVVGIFIEGISSGPFPLPYYFSLAWLSFLSAAAISIWYTLLKTPGVKVSELNMWKFIIPVFGAALSWIILPDETPDISSIIGMILVAVALVSVNWQKKSQDKPDHKQHSTV